jgi:hypothetical protein
MPVAETDPALTIYPLCTANSFTDLPAKTDTIE